VTDPIVLFAATTLGAVGAVSAYLAVRNRLSLRIALRNIVRARGRSVLVILGLLVATAIVSGSLVVGDTVHTATVHYSYIGWGYTDEAIYGTSSSGGYLYFSSIVANSVVTASANDSRIDGVSPEIVGTVQAFDNTTGIPQTNLYLVGSNASQSAALGPFTSVSGGNPGSPAPGSIFLDKLAAQDLSASVGDSVLLYGKFAAPEKVGAIVQDDIRGGFLTAGVSGGSVFVDLATAQALQGTPQEVNFIAVTNAGSQESGVGLSSAVSASLTAALATIPGTSALSVHQVLSDSLATAQSASTSLTTIFLVFGLFSIIAGAMLIIGIFTMIAEERKGEMGMLRAVGIQRRTLVLAYYFEGLVYSAGSALAGTFAGVAAGYILLWFYVHTVPTPGFDVNVLGASFTFSSSSLITSYLVGFLLTLATVVVASVRVSRLNIVRAIRDVPEPLPPLRTYTYLAYLGGVSLAVGALLFLTTFRGSSDISYPVIGGALVILGAGLVASRFWKNRTVFTSVGAGLLLWAGVEPLHDWVLGTGHSGGIFFVFVDGVMLVAGALMIVAFNGVDLARSVERLAAGRKGATPVTRIGLAYPSRRAARTSISLTIFALVLFTIILLAVYSATLTGNLNNSVTSQSGGYTFLGISSQPIPDLPSKVATNSTLSALYSGVVPVTTGLAFVSVQGFSANPYHDNLFSAPVNTTAETSFYATNQFTFQSTDHGMSASAVMAELQSNRSVAVVDGGYAGGSGFGQAGPHPSVAPGDMIEVENPGTLAAQNVTVIGVLEESIVGGVWLNPSTAASLGYLTLNGYFLTVHPGVSSTLAAQKIKSAFYQYGLVLVDFRAILAQTTAIISGDIGLLEVFIALGLAVGIAALGILALRAVTERRHEIGTLRATGLTRPMIIKAFLVEYSFITIVGALVGGLLGLLVVYNFTISPGSSAAYAATLFVPWWNLLAVILVTGLLATLAVIGPSLRAARLPPAEAIRGVE
jgi:putative ABC transport system permease protein